jgi:polyisoprenoid-binding protein YceI
MNADRLRWTPLLVLLLALPVPSAVAGEYTIASGEKHNLVVFESTAPMETFHGKTHAVSGFVNLDPSALGDTLTLQVTADLASLDTGIGLRNKHMRENHLETKKYPNAVFRGGRILESSWKSLLPGETATLKIRGTMQLHGVTRELVVPVTATARDDGRLAINAAFDIALADYEISRPKFLMLKLNDVQNVSVELLLDPKP